MKAAHSLQVTVYFLPGMQHPLVCRGVSPDFHLIVLAIQIVQVEEKNGRIW